MLILKLWKKWITDRRGSGEAITFAATTLLVMFIVLQFYQPVLMLIQQMVLENVHRSALLEMESQGGLTSEIEYSIKNQLGRFHFDPERVSVTSSTLYPVQYGQPIELTISYETSYTNYGLRYLTIQSEDDQVQIQVTRSSISREYFKNGG